MTLKKNGFDNYLTYFEHNINSFGIPTIFIHGVGLDNTMWLPQKKFFKDKKIIFYDLLNHGKTKKGYTELNFYDFTYQLNNLVKYLKIKKCNLVGFSIGALIAQHFSEQFYEKINKLILLGSIFDRNKEQIRIVKNRFQQASEGKSISEESIKRWFNENYLTKNPNIYDFFFNILKNNKKIDFLAAYKVFVEADDYFIDFSKLKMPTLIMTGENEVGSTPYMSKMLSKKIKNSEVSIIPNAKHMATFESSHIVNQLISNFLY
tara:strand:- start:44 stop:829 length:786 start_codon:yes stop_codon:yes gene_type:complete